MAFTPNSSYVKNVAIPQYRLNADYQYQGQTPYQDGPKSSSHDIYAHNNAAFLNNNKNAAPINPTFHGVVLPQKNPPPYAYQRQELGPVGSSRKPNPVHLNGVSLTEATTARPSSVASSLDYHSLLLSLAEDYFAAARDRSSLTGLLRKELEIQTYHKLIATGLACLEAVLKVSFFF